MFDALAPFRSQTLVLNEGDEIFCVAGQLLLSESPHLLGDTLCNFRIRLATGQSWRAGRRTVVRLQSNHSCQFKQISTEINAEAPSPSSVWTQLRKLLQRAAPIPVQPADS